MKHMSKAKQRIRDTTTIYIFTDLEHLFESSKLLDLNERENTSRTKNISLFRLDSDKVT